MATTTAIPAGTTDWADLGIPGAGSIMALQPTSAETLFTRINLSTPTVTHMWAYQPAKGGAMPTGGYVIVQSLAVPLAARSQTKSSGVS